ncbi:MAG TPA: DUF3157 family protein [Chitinispirillaceae bacterium]|nr:DUF3157 family protein [Chitinispirillaceae bacterium]
MRFFILMAGLLAVLIFNVSAGDMILTLDDGREAILHEDNTWGFAHFSVTDGSEEDLYITLDNNKTICLKTDYTWDYSKGKPPQKKTEKELPSIFADGSATRPTLDQAVQAAVQEAITRATTRLLPYAKKSKETSRYLSACIKNELGPNGAETSYNPGWSAKAKVTLTNIQVKNILECVTTQIDLANPAKTETVKK